MKIIVRFVFTLLSFLPLCLSAQQKGVVKGRVVDSKNNEPVPFANVVIWKTTTGTATDENGYFRIENVPLGYNRLEISSVGYTTKLSEEFLVNTASERTVNVELEESQVNLEQVTVKANPFRKTVESQFPYNVSGLPK
ncbi:MAG: carboxypeptidase-like regulatory domain-containing protein [Butyricimonas faecalis]